ncbi:alpha/beta hydrolase [Actinomadura parmotrematis]|uniref:Alpha/beta hydrolase family protein n=1 Tax=Actinomadura parmotrematis TaxID=2864039 RepID=A0ABS7FZH8_9ACTN|nr:alpha/beta hydrolase [Actinomadura parmotrematis]MBW8484838.1 alpha/beta hydrolase family protein [Actinomadura parmotrematis]
MRRFLTVSTLLVAGGPLLAPGAGQPYAAPAAPPALTGPAALPARYAAVRTAVRTAAATADRVHDTGRARAFRALAAPGRTLLSFDPRGSGRAVEVIGDLAAASRVAVVVPGADGRLTNFDDAKWAGGGARAVAAEARAQAPGTRLAVVAWLGYASPSTTSLAVATTGRADGGARALRALITDLHRADPRARVALLCHSYGSVVCGRAVTSGLPVDEIALYGSPGTTQDTSAGVRTAAHVWAGRARGDWMRYVPKVRLAGLGFGRDPVSPAFGARVFDAGTGAHGAYLLPGTTSLRNITRIALALEDQVTRHA